MQKEYKSFPFLEKTIDDDGTLRGKLAVYGNVDLGGDLIKPGAFTKTLRESKGKVPMLFNHEPGSPIGSMRLKDSSSHLEANGKINLKVQKGSETHALLKDGDLDGLSIGYAIVKSDIRKIDGQRVQVLQELKLFEGSVVAVPMNPQTRVSDVKTCIEELHARGAVDELEKFQILLRKMVTECEARILDHRKAEPFDWLVHETELEVDGAKVLREVLSDMRR